MNAFSPDHRPPHRQTRTVSVEGRSRGSAVKGESIDVTQVMDLPSRMHSAGQIDNRQYVALRRLCRLWWGTRLGSRVASSYGAPGGRALSGVNDDEDGPEDHYHDVMRAMPDGYRALVRNLIDERYPGRRFLLLVRSALDWLADHWGVERDPDPHDHLMIIEE